MGMFLLSVLSHFISFGGAHFFSVLLHLYFSTSSRRSNIHVTFLCFTCRIPSLNLSRHSPSPRVYKARKRGYLYPKHLKVVAGTGFTFLLSADDAMAPDGSGETRRRIRERIGHVHPPLNTVVALVDAHNPTFPVLFDADLLPPSYHYTDYSRVLTITALASLTPQNWVIEERQR